MEIDEKNDDTNGMWKKVSNTDEIFETILVQNAKMLTKSKDGVTAKGDFGRAIRINAENKDFVERILEGKINPSLYEDKNMMCTVEANEFIRQMKQKENIKTMKWKFEISEYKKLYSKTRENMTCGPSGLHMSHWS